MNVENIQKLNQVSRDLLKHGLATSMDEAVKKAQQMVNAQALADSESIIIENRPDTLAVSPVSSRSRQETHPLDQHQAQEKKGGTIMETIGEKGDSRYVTVEEFNRLKATVREQDERISMVISKMNEFIREINALSSMIKKQAEASRSAPREEAPARHETSEAPRPVAQPGGTPRSGNFTSEDVAIDKFFYSGPKK